MDPMLLMVYHVQIETQCEGVIKAAEDLNAALKAHNVNLVFCAIQALLTSAANISKALWGVPKNTAALTDRKPLRDRLKVDDNSPLRPLTMRNNYDHFDQRIDKWWKDSKTRNYTDLNIGSLAAYQTGDTNDIFRLYDAATKDTFFWGDKFNLGDIIEEAKRIQRVPLLFR